MAIKVYSIIVLIYCTLLLASGAQLSKRINESLTIECPCEDTSICDWYHNDQLVPSEWIQANGDLLLPANDWSVYGVIGGQCGSGNYTYMIINPGMYTYTYLATVAMLTQRSYEFRCS